MIKTIQIYKNPLYYGDKITKSQAAKIARRMTDCALKADFEHRYTYEEGTLDELAIYEFGMDEDDVDNEIVDWIGRFRTHGFRGMVRWLESLKI